MLPSVEDVLPPLPRKLTGSPLAQLQAAVAGVADLDALSAPGRDRELYLAVFALQGARAELVEKLAAEAVKRLDAATETALVELFESHPWALVRQSVGTALVGAGASRATLGRLARAMDLPEDGWVRVRDVGTAAAVRVDPRTAYDRLRARFEAEHAKRHSNLFRGLLVALGALETPIDPRWFPLLLRFYDHREAVMVDSFLQQHPEAVPAVTDFVAERARNQLPWLSHVGFTLRHWKEAARPAVAAVAEAAAVAAAQKQSDYRLTGPLDTLIAIGDASVVPALQQLAAATQRQAKTAVEEALKSLGAAPLPKAARKQKPAAAPKDPERAALAQTLAKAGFGEERVAELVALARNRIVLTVDKKGKVAPGASRFGGDPELPPRTPWPTHGKQKTPLGFVAQLRLEDLAPLDSDGKLPAKGLLSFFVRQDVEAGEHGDLLAAASRVLYFEAPKQLVSAAPPAELAEHDRHPARALKGSRELPLPEPQHARKLSLLVDESRRYDALCGAAKRGAIHGALGHARAVYYQGLPGKGETLLLQLGSGEGTDFEWGDASCIFFLIADKALAARDFSKVVCVADES